MGKVRIVFSILALLGSWISGHGREKDDLYEINLAKRDSSVRATVFTEKKTIRTKPGLTYYWFAYNQIHYTQGGCDGRALHGAYACFYPNGNLKQKGNYNSGLRNGEWIQWYRNGAIREISHWNNGLKQGSWQNYDSLGSPTKEAYYKKGLLDGKETIYESGKIISVKKFKKGIEVIKKEKKPRKEISPINKPSKESVSPPREKKKLLERLRKKKDPEQKDEKPRVNADKK